jgi:hypothetical protein
VQMQIQHVRLVVVEETVENAMRNQIVVSVKIADRKFPAQEVLDHRDAEHWEQKVDQRVPLPFSYLGVARIERSLDRGPDSDRVRTAPRAVAVRVYTVLQGQLHLGISGSNIQLSECRCSVPRDCFHIQGRSDETRYRFGQECPSSQLFVSRGKNLAFFQ